MVVHGHIQETDYHKQVEHRLMSVFGTALIGPAGKPRLVEIIGFLLKLKDILMFNYLFLISGMHILEYFAVQTDSRSAVKYTVLFKMLGREMFSWLTMSEICRGHIPIPLCICHCDSAPDLHSFCCSI